MNNETVNSEFYKFVKEEYNKAVTYGTRFSNFSNIDSDSDISEEYYESCIMLIEGDILNAARNGHNTIEVDNDIFFNPMDKKYFDRLIEFFTNHGFTINREDDCSFTTTGLRKWIFKSLLLCLLRTLMAFSLIKKLSVKKLSLKPKISFYITLNMMWLLS
jgi:hypothetical protein